MGVTNDCGIAFKLTSRRETYVTTCPGSNTQVSGVHFYTVTKSNIRM